jgi:hypothetical protein
MVKERREEREREVRLRKIALKKTYLGNEQICKY